MKKKSKKLAQGKFVYLSKENAEYAKKVGKPQHRSVSAYINHLIVMDREKGAAA